MSKRVNDEIIELDDNTQINDLDDSSFEDLLSNVRMQGQGDMGDDDDDDNELKTSPSTDLSKLLGEGNTGFFDTDDDDDADNDIDDSDDEDDDDDEPAKPVAKEPVKKDKSVKKEKPVAQTEPVSSDEESEYVSGMFEVLSEQYGWEVDEEKKPKSIEDFVEYVEGVIQEKSVPSYSTDEVAQLDEYVRNGGRMEDFLKASSALDFDNVDIENESEQRRVVKTLLKVQGLSDERINRKIEKYEDAGILEDEAEEALEYLKEYAENQKQALLEEQKAIRAQMEERQKSFVSGVIKEIETLKDIRGINIPEKEKRAVLEYLFKADKNGVTQFSKTLSENPKALIEAAYFMKNPDKVIESVKRKGESDAVNRLRNKLKNTPKTAKTKQTPLEGYVPFYEMI